MGTRRVIIAGLVTLLGLITATPAGASPPVDRDQFKIEDSFVDPFLSEVCGVEVTVDLNVKVTLTARTDTSFSVKIVESTTFRSEHGSIHVKASTMIRFDPERLVDNGDGTETVLIDHTEAGVVLFKTSNGVLTRDAGIIDWQIQITFDSETGEFLGEEEVVLDVKGPHPTLESGGRLDVICAAVAA